MYYTKFTIENFKGISNLTLDLDKKPNGKVFTLVGLNESGKTTILEAISLLNSFETPDNVHDYIPKNLRANFNGQIKITATLTLEDNDKEKITTLLTNKGYKKITVPDKLRIFKSFVFENSENKLSDYKKRIYMFSVTGQKPKSKKTSEITYKSDIESYNEMRDALTNILIPPILYYPNFLFDFPERIYLEKQSNEGDEQLLYREILSDILASIDPSLSIQTHIIDRIKSTKTDAKRSLESTLLKMNAKITKTVFGAWDALFDSKGKEIIITSNTDEDGEYYFEFNLKEHSNYFQISERSLGFRWFFTFLLFTEFRKSRNTKTGETLFMLDEPASNLHSTAQKKLLETFEDILVGSKLIYTTHSHHLINPKWLSGAYIVRNKAMDYESDFDYDAAGADIEATLYKQFVANHPNQKTFFQPILDTLDYQPGLLEEVPGVIITEGKNDFYSLKYLIKVLDKELYHNLKIYPGGGANRNSNTIALYLGWKKSFIVLLDSDKGGSDAKKVYLKEFGEVIEGKVQTFKDIDSKFTNCAMEDLFSTDDRIKITQLFDPKLSAFKKSAFNTSIEQLYISNSAIDLSKETKDNFQIILDYLTKYFN